MIDKSFLEKLEEMARPETVEVGGLWYSTRQLFPVKLPEPKPLQINTLTGIVDYLKEKVDWSASERRVMFLHVVSHDVVTLRSHLFGDFEQRDAYLTAAADIKPFAFGQWFDVESFIINLKSLFVMTDDLAAVLEYTAGLREESSRELKDDGIAQRTTVRHGTGAIAQAVTIQSQVNLKPYRTFLEIDQPESRFVFRLRPGKDGEKPSCALFEGDGGAWKLTAIQSIREWLQGSTDIPIIA